MQDCRGKVPIYISKVNIDCIYIQPYHKLQNVDIHCIVINILSEHKHLGLLVICLFNVCPVFMFCCTTYQTRFILRYIHPFNLDFIKKKYEPYAQCTAIEFPITKSINAVGITVHQATEHHQQRRKHQIICSSYN